jgi:acyl dehydratase
MDGLATQALAEQVSARESRWFEDFHVGERFVLPPRLLGATQLTAYAEASGEAYPLHTDPAWCHAHDFPDVVAHGFLVVAQTSAGSGSFPFLVEDSLVGLVEQSSRFLRPVHDGDTLYPVLTVTELAPNSSTGVVGLRSTLHNQRREMVLEGMQRWLLRMRLRG